MRCVSLKVVQPPGASTLGHDERNMALGREMSPHLTIYKPQLTSMLSITHRFMGEHTDRRGASSAKHHPNASHSVVGIALTGYAAALGLGALVLPNDLAAWITVIEGLQLSAPTLAAAKFTLAFPATYHTLNGVRHLCWDNGLFLQLSEVYTTGWLMLALAVVSAGGLAAL